MNRSIHTPTFAAGSRHRDNGALTAGWMFRAGDGSETVNVYALAVRCVH